MRKLMLALVLSFLAFISVTMAGTTYQTNKDQNTWPYGKVLAGAECEPEQIAQSATGKIKWHWLKGQLPPNGIAARCKAITMPDPEPTPDPIPEPTPMPSGASIVLDDFENGLRIVQPNTTTDDKYLWNLYSGSGPTSITTTDKYDGTHSLLSSQGGAPWQFHIYTYTEGLIGYSDGWKFVKTFAKGAWENNKYNRLRFRIKLPAGLKLESNGEHNFEFGTFLRCSTCSGGETNNMHFYHLFNFESTGEWEQVIVDAHPNHQRGENGNTEQGVQNPEPGFTYFDLMTRFYLDFPYTLPAGNILMDGFEFYEETRPENVEQVYSIHGTYSPATNTIRIGWMRNKNENAVKHEVRYAYTDIHELGWDNATPAPNGIITPPGWQGYNGMMYSTAAIGMAGHTTLYLAIRPQDSARFSQIAIPVN